MLNHNRLILAAGLINDNDLDAAVLLVEQVEQHLATVARTLRDEIEASQQQLNLFLINNEDYLK